MLNLDKIIVQNPEILASFGNRINDVRDAAHDIQKRFGILPGVGNANGIITPITQTVIMGDGSTRTYTIETSLFWAAYDNLNNEYISDSVGLSILNHGHALFEILKNWQTDLGFLFNDWDKKYKISSFKY